MKEEYLAIPLDTYETFFQLPFTQFALSQYKVKLIIYNLDTEEINQWLI